ncbi:MAG TPA: hypothetical protein DC058_00765 [Planctomycetaceae bacterium]|nr:hypothetical protein [Planctomycetaceae bacterium]
MRSWYDWAQRDRAGSASWCLMPVRTAVSSGESLGGSVGSSLQGTSLAGRNSPGLSTVISPRARSRTTASQSSLFRPPASTASSSAVGSPDGSGCGEVDCFFQ